MIDAATKAKWVLGSKNVSGVPAQALGSIADSEGIKHICNDYPDDDWDGTLIYKSKKRAIVINTHRGSELRHNFTFAHELGHHFLEHEPTYNENGRMEIRCTPQDIAQGGKRIEDEANQFAVELLMPEDRFRLSMAGAELDFDLMKSLSIEYQVSKEACVYRILDFTREPCAVIFTKNGATIRSMKISRAGRGAVMRLRELPEGSLARTVIANNSWQRGFEECDSSLWLAKGQQGFPFFSCTHGSAEFAMTILRW